MKDYEKVGDTKSRRAPKRGKTHRTACWSRFFFLFCFVLFVCLFVFLLKLFNSLGLSQAKPNQSLYSLSMFPWPKHGNDHTRLKHRSPNAGVQQCTEVHLCPPLTRALGASDLGSSAGYCQHWLVLPVTDLASTAGL